jgi:hypothetical protein
MGAESAKRFDAELLRITTREQAMKHLDKVLNDETSFNPSSFPAEIVEDPSNLDVVVFFRTDDGELASAKDPYNLFLNRYNIADGSIPSYKFKIDEWNSVPCLRVRVAE